MFLALSTVFAAAVSIPAAAHAEDSPTWSHQLTYTADVTGALQGGEARAGRVLDNIDLILEGDLEKAIGWRDTKVHAYVLNNSGGRPNDIVRSLQGVDNIEVAQPRLRLYEAWVEHGFGAVSALAGLYNLNSEFYTTDTSGLLIAPPFGIGSELASTGPNGPSIFPLTALAVRFKTTAEKGAYAEAAVLSAHSGTIGQSDQLQLGMDNGALVIGEAGWRGPGRVAVGLWGYTEAQDDIRDTTPDGSPERRRSQGVYVLAEGPLKTWTSGAELSGFLRAGRGDGDTSPYDGGWQAGVKLEHVVPGRPKAAFSAGVQQGYLSRKQRANGADEGRDIGPTESGVELVYADSIGRVSFRPDLQFIFHPEGDRARDTAVVGALRLIIDLN
jgi:porin